MIINRPILSGGAMRAAAIGFALAMASGPPAVAADCKLAMLSEWPVRLEGNQLLVEGALNGQPARVKLDTGSPRTLLNRATAARLNVVRKELSKRERSASESNLEIASLDEFRVVDFKRAPWRMLIAPDREFDADVLLGEDFLSLVDVEFDLEYNTLRLFKPENCEGKNLAHWASAGQSVGEVKIDAILPTQPQIVLDVAINGQSISALLDSGAASSVLDKPAAARLGATPESPGVTSAVKRAGVGGKMQPVWSAPFQSFTIGSETDKDVRLEFSELYRDTTNASIGSHIPTKGDGLQQMLLGVDFLRSHRVLVSHSQKRIYFTHNGGPAFQSSPPAEAKPAAPAK